MAEWFADVIHAWRRLRSAPSFTAFSVLTLALGIGATTAIYSVVYAAVLRPPDIPNIDSVANLYHSDPRTPRSGPMGLWLSRLDYQDYRARQTSFEFLAAWRRFYLPLSANRRADFLMGEAVGGEYFSVVGIQSALGRVIQPQDDAPEAPRVVVLSDTLWRRRFGADPAILGRTIKLGEETFEIVGVISPKFRGVDMPNVQPTAAWIPLSAVPGTDPEELVDRERRTVFAKGRLKPGRSMTEAQAEFRAIAQGLDLAYPLGAKASPGNRPGNTSRRWFLMPAANVKMHESVDPLVRPLVAAIMIAVGLVLLVACTNVSNLVLARGAARQHEMAVRLALGASRWRLIREQLIEAALVTIAGSAAACAVARILMVRVFSAELRPAPGMFVQFAPEMNLPVAAVALGSTVLALIVFGLIPAVHGSRGSVRDAMASDGQNSPIPRWRGRRGLIACQVAVSAGLVSIAALCAQQLIALARHDVGIDINRLTLARVNMTTERGGEAQGRRILEEMLYAARQLPGVQSAALSSGFPIDLTGGGGAVAATPQELTGGRYAFIVSTPDVFATWGVELLQGRVFDGRDTASSQPVVVVTEGLARSLFPEGPAIGRSFVLRWARSARESVAPVQTVTVIGVVRDTDVGNVGNRGGGLLYLPWPQHYQPTMVVSVRTSGKPSGLVDPLERLINRIGQDVTVMDVQPASALAGANHLVLQVAGWAAGLLGALALVLAMAGLYGVLSELVLRRTRELGIRMALGADADRLRHMVLWDGAKPVLMGLAIGLGCGVILRFSFRPLFIRMLPAFDPVVVALVPLAFLAAALLAAYLPARRASRVDPNVALRHV